MVEYRAAQSVFRQLFAFALPCKRQPIYIAGRLAQNDPVRPIRPSRAAHDAQLIYLPAVAPSRLPGTHEAQPVNMNSAPSDSPPLNVSSCYFTGDLWSCHFKG